MTQISRLVTALVSALLVVSATASAQTTSASTATPPATGVDELAGLWKAKRWFGAFESTRLIIQRNGQSYSADMLGRAMPVRAEKAVLSFVLPDSQGEFRGTLEADGVHGRWLSRGAKGGGVASPVFLPADGRNRWIGDVRPGRSEFTLYLLAQKRPDGLMGVLLRNPERDIGSQFGIERLTRDGNVVKLFGKRGQQAEREFATGSYDAERQIISLPFPDRGGSYEFQREAEQQSDFYPRGKTPGAYRYHPPPALDDGWPTSTLEEENIDRAGIEKMIQVLLDAPMDVATTPKIHALLVARHGRLVLEEYFHGEHRERLHQVYSAAKSITTTIIGAAMFAGAPLKLSSPVYEVMNGGSFPAGLEPAKREMTLEHLLTMSSGLFCDDDNDDAPANEERLTTQTEEPDFNRFTLKVPLATPPGEKAVYCSASANLALGMVTRATGTSALDAFDRLIAAPLKIRRYSWWVVPDGQPYGAGGVGFVGRDFMKFGQLMLNGGTWQGHRILSREFVTRASSPAYHLWGWQYAYLWWVVDYPYKDRTVRAFFAGGSGGQVVIVVPALDLVIATYGGNYFSPGGWYVQLNLTPQYLLPAVREAGDDRNAPVVPRKDFAPKKGPEDDSGPIRPEH
jgi:CubicO group peptidase (beta-lactamase class C family)